MAKEKIIFLDVDGVLNSSDFGKRYLQEEGVNCFAEDILDERALRRLKNIVNTTGAEVVISSSWRWDRRSMENLREQLADIGVVPIDTTLIDIRSPMTRAQEIRLWLDEHPDIKDYVILDDTPIEDADLERHHITTTIAHGLQFEHIDLATKILNGDLN